MPETPRDQDPHAPGTDGDEFHRVVRRFVRAHRQLLMRDPNPVPEFGAFRTAVLDAAESPLVIADTGRALEKVHGASARHWQDGQ
jgi:hypothetical protein